MKEKYLNILLSVFVVAAILATVFLFRLYSGGKPSKEESFPTPIPRKGEIGYQEKDTKVKIGSEEFSSGKFRKIEAGSIFFDDGGDLTTFPLTQDEVVLSCTSQYLPNASELDLDQVISIDITTPSELSGKIPKDEFIVVHASDVAGKVTAHTVFIDAS